MAARRRGVAGRGCAALLIPRRKDGGPPCGCDPASAICGAPAIGPRLCKDEPHFNQTYQFTHAGTKETTMAMMTVKHEGGVSSSINVRGHRVIADAPAAMGGEDRGPTPVDLLAGSLGTCIVFYVARYCKEANLPFEGFHVDLDYVHDREAHCVPELTAVVRMPAGFPKEREQALLRVAGGCTVHNTLCSMPKIEVTVGAS